MYPASTTKLMTAILTLENCELTDVATVSHNAVYSIPSGYAHASLVEGEELTIEELLNLLLIPSANDAAIVLAEHIAGSVEDFATMMNEKAEELGCLDTHFVNPNGIHDEDHYTTAYDLSLIGLYAMQFDDILRIAQVTQYTLDNSDVYTGEERIFNTTNDLINPNDSNYYEYTTGLKTGYTTSAGSCIVATAEKNGVNLLAVTLKSETSDERHDDCVKLFDYGFNNYSYKNIVSAGTVIDTLTVDGATPETELLDIITKGTINILIKNSIDLSQIEKTIEINENLTAPIAEGAVVGSITYTIDGKTYSTELIAETSVEESNIELYISRAVLIGLIFIIFIFAMTRLHKLNNKGKKKR